MSEIYLNLNKKELKETERLANQEAIDSDPNDEDKKGELLYELEWPSVESEFDDGNIHLYGNAVFKGKDIGYLDITFKLDHDLVIEIIEAYTKKLNKVKAMLESTK
jgi:hypothetical protein